VKGKSIYFKSKVPHKLGLSGLLFMWLLFLFQFLAWLSSGLSVRMHTCLIFDCHWCNDVKNKMLQRRDIFFCTQEGWRKWGMTYYIQRKSWVYMAHLVVKEGLAGHVNRMRNLDVHTEF
jgi:hypothetical protein